MRSAVEGTSLMFITPCPADHTSFQAFAEAESRERERSREMRRKVRRVVQGGKEERKGGRRNLEKK
jgi:hypothetical protein